MAVVEGVNVGGFTQLPATISALGNIVNGIVNTAKNVGTVLTNPNQNQVAQAVQQLQSTFGIPSYTPTPQPYQTVYAPGAGQGVPLQAPGTVQSYYQPQQQYATTYSQSTVTTPYTGQPVTVNATVPVTVTIPQQQNSFNIPELFTSLATTVLPALVKAVAPETSGIVNAVQGAINNVIAWQNNSNNQTITAIDSLSKNLQTLVNNTISQNNSQIDATIARWGQQVNTATHEASTLVEDFINKYSQQQLDAIRANSRTADEFTKTISQFVDTYKSSIPKFDEVVEQQERSRLHDVQDAQTNLFDILAQIAKILLRWTNNPQLVGKSLVDSSTDIIGNVIKDSVSDYVKGYDKLFNDLSSGKITDYKQLINHLGDLSADKQILWSAVNLVSVINMFFKFLSALGSARTERIEQLAMAEVRPSLLSPQDYISYVIRNPTQIEYIVDELHKSGLADDKIKVLQDLSVRLLTAIEYSQANFRGFITDDRFEELLSSLGYDDEHKTIIDKIRYFYPPVQDLIAMMVHEVFTPDARKAYNLDSDYPAQFTELAKKAGLSEEWSRNYWANHWQYPSPEQVFEMLHRAALEPELKDVSIETVAQYLKVADYAPVWRPRLTAIAYQPLTRIDIRRIYKQGGKDKQWLHNHHLAIGYNERDANELDNFTIDTQLPEDDNDISRLNDQIETTIKSRYIAGAISDVNAIEFLRAIGKSDKYIAQWLAHLDLLKKVAGYENETSSLKDQLNSAVISALKRGNISNSIARHYLIDNGLTQQQADMRITFANLQYTIALKAKAQDVYTQQYAVHNLDDESFRQALSLYFFTPQEADNALQEAVLARIQKTKKPTEKQIITWFNNGVITEDELANELRGLGYDDKYVALYMEDILQGKEINSNA